MIKLAREDWAEIYYALDSKVKMLELGEYGPTVDDDTDISDWAKHLRRILKKIRPEGERKEKV